MKNEDGKMCPIVSGFTKCADCQLYEDQQCLIKQALRELAKLDHIAEQLDTLNTNTEAVAGWLERVGDIIDESA